MVIRIAQESISDTVGLGVLLLLIALAVASVVLWVAAVLSVLRSHRLTGGGKFLWIVVIFVFPLLGSIGWFMFGKNAQLRRGSV